MKLIGAAGSSTRLVLRGPAPPLSIPLYPVTVLSPYYGRLAFVCVHFLFLKALFPKYGIAGFSTQATSFCN